MEFKELTTKTEAELQKMLAELRTEAHEFSVKVRLAQEKKTHKLKNLKKDIARVLTHLHNLKSKTGK